MIIAILISPAPLCQAGLPATEDLGSGIDRFTLGTDGSEVGESGSFHDEGEAKILHVVLVTGDVVTVTQYPSGRRSFAVRGVEANEAFAIFTIRNETYVVPQSANLKKLDLTLFNIDYLLREEYFNLDSVPVLISSASTVWSSSVAKDPSVKGFVKKVFKSIPAIAAKATFEEVRNLYKALMKRAEVAKVWLDRKIHADLDESVPLIGAPSVWLAGYDGTGIRIAILDTGIDSTHPDVSGKVIDAVDFSDDGTPDDLHGHGTHVAATAAGTGAASGGTFKGVAPGASLMNIKVLNQYGSGWSSWIISGIEYATANGADIISMSLGGGPTDGNDPMSLAVDAAVDSGVVVTVAAGNSGDYYFSVSTPGAARKAITVGASDKSDSLAWFSSRGPTLDFRVKPDIVAPGVDIISARATNSPRPWNPEYYPPYYTYGWSGTSMATPHVAGLAALVLQRHPEWDQSQVKEAIMNTAIHLDGYNVFQEGTGRISAPDAVSTTVLLDEPTYSFGIITDGAGAPSHGYSVHNYGGGQITVDLSVSLIDVATGSDWSGNALISDPTLVVDPGSSASFDLIVEMAGLPVSMYSGVLVATVEGTGQELRSAFGFVRLNTVTVTKLDFSGNPVPGHMVWKWKTNPSTDLDYWLNLWWDSTDDNGQVVFYHTDGNYEIVTVTWGGPPVFTIADNLPLTGNTAYTLDERTTNRVDFDPKKSGQILAARRTQLYYPSTSYYSWGFGSLWSYPASTESWVSTVSSSWKATFGYSYYPSSDFDLTDSGTVNTSEWHDLLYSSEGVPSGGMHFVADYSTLVQKWSAYPVNLGPEVGAWRWANTYSRLFDDPSTGFVPGWYWDWTYGWKMSLPQARMEYLSPDVWYDQGVEKVWDVPWQWTSGWLWHGPYRAWGPGDRWSERWNTVFTNNLFGWVGPDGWLQVYGHAIMDGYRHGYHDYGRWPAGTFTLTGPGGTIYSGSIDDYFDLWSLHSPGVYTATLEATSTQQLSTRMTSTYMFDTSLPGSILPDGSIEVPQICFRPTGLNLENTASDGTTFVGIRAYSWTYPDETPMAYVAAWYSIDDGLMWNPLTVNDGGWTNYYLAELPHLSDKFVSLKAIAINALGSSVTQTTIRAFYVAAGQPIPFTSYWLRNPVTFDGRMTVPDEWSDAIPQDLTLRRGDSLTTASATFWMKNDVTWLYILERVEWPGGVPGRDNWDSGSIAYFWDHWGPPWEHSDLGGVNFDGSTFDLYGWDEVQWHDDTLATPPGVNNVEGAATYDGRYYWFEFRKPLMPGDGYDWTFEPGGTYGPMPPDLMVGFWDDSEARFYGTDILLHLWPLGSPGGRAGISQPYILGFKVSDVYSDSATGDFSYSTTGWSASDASFQVTLAQDESIFLIGTAQVWNDYPSIGSSIAITRDGVTRVSGDMFAAGATITSRELAAAIAVDTPGAGTYTYSLSTKTDPGGKAWVSQPYILGFKISNVYSDSAVGDGYVSTMAWSPTDAGIQVPLGAGESLFLIGAAQVWNDRATVGSSIGICRDSVRVSGDMFAAGATITRRELAVAIAVYKAGPACTYTYPLSGKTD